MKNIKTLVSTVAIAVLLTSVTVGATTNSTAGEYTFTVAGSGATSTKGASDTKLGGEFSLGKDIGKLGFLPAEIGVRQSVNYASANNDVVLGTKVYSDWTLLKVSRFQLQAGGNVGAKYLNTPLAWSAAPEAVLKFSLKNDVYAYGRVEYGFDLSNQKANDSLGYTFGVGLRF